MPKASGCSYAALSPCDWFIFPIKVKQGVGFYIVTYELLCGEAVYWVFLWVKRRNVLTV